jgi:hypothetical protein
MTIEGRMEALEKELARARSRNRWSLTGAILVIAGGIVLCGKAAGPRSNKAQSQTAAGAVKEVQARQFTVVDQNGRARAQLSAGDYNVALVFLDTVGKPHAAIILGDDGLPQIGLSDKTGTMRAILGVEQDGPALHFYDRENNGRAVMKYNDNHGSEILLADEEGKIFWFEPQ